MTTYVEEFPLRTIHLLFGEKEPTSLETSGLVAYKNLHNELWEMKLHWMQCLEQQEAMNLTVKQLQSAYTAMETEAKKYGRVAGYPDDEILQVLEEKDEYKVKMGDLQERINDFSALVDRYNEQNNRLNEDMKTGEEMKDRFDESFEHFDREYFHPIIKNYEKVQIDIVSFDRDFDQFRCLIGEVWEIWDNYLDQSEAMTTAVLQLNQDVEELNKHIICISATINAPSPESDQPELN